MTVVSKVRVFVESYELGIYSKAEIAKILNANASTVSSALATNGAVKKKKIHAVDCLVELGFSLELAIKFTCKTFDNYMVLVNTEKRRIKNEEEKKQKV